MQPRKKKWKRIVVLIIFLIFAIILFKKAYRTFNFREKNDTISKLINVAQEIKVSSNTQGTTYYVSSDGKSYSGTDINNPMSLSTAIRKNV